MKLLSGVLALLVATQSGAAPIVRSNYSTDDQKLCDGLPQISVGTQQGMCVGMMHSKDAGLRMPRYATQGKDGIIYITDMAGWVYGRGTVWASYETKNSDGSVQRNLVNLFPTQKLIMPNGILMDPEGRLYVGTPTGILRFDPRDRKTGAFNIDSKPEVIVDQFTKSLFRTTEYQSASTFNNLEESNKNKHPLVQLAANKDFTEIYFNVGAPSDACSRGFKTINEQNICIQSESQLANAAIWKADLSKDKDRKVLHVDSFARGLRNSMALAVHPASNSVLQGENGIDLKDEDRPYEEINFVEKGKYYGWPYCHSDGQVSPFFKDKIDAADCLKKYTQPVVFMPAHVAPLGLLFYSGDKLSGLNNKLLVSWHGYKDAGHRIVAYPIDNRGVPSSNQYSQVVFGWDAKAGIRPMGAPTGLLQLNDGSILILDDKNAAILRLSAGTASDVESDNRNAKVPTVSEAMLRNFAPLVPFVNKNCVMCHQNFNNTDSAKILNSMIGSMINLQEPKSSSFYIKLKTRQMPPSYIRDTLHFTDEDYQKIDADLEKFINSVGAQ